MSRPSWRDHMGHLAWPTLALTAAVWSTVLVSTSLALAGQLPLALAGAVNGLCVYLAFTPMHEAAHGNVGGTKARAWLDRWVGWSCSLLFLAPFPAFKAVHLRHHSTVNQPGKDPDHWVRGSHPLGVAARCLTMVPHYYWMFLGPMAKNTRANRRDRAVSVAALVALGVGVLLGTLGGFGVELLVLWLVPAWLASGALAFAFDWLPHHPHGDTDRWTNARVLDLPLLPWLLLGQSHHLVHHLWPRVPFYRYTRVFREQRDELQAHGSPVVTWRARSERAPT